MKFIGAVLLTFSVLAGGTVEGGLATCGKWYTTTTTTKTYSPCNTTTIGPWTSPVGGCLQWVSWRRYQFSIPYNRAPYQNRRTLLENEVRARWTIQVGPVRVTKTQTVWGSHTTKVISTSRVSTSALGVCV